MLKIVIADDHPLIREGLKRILAQNKDWTVVGEASDGPEALQLTQKLKPDIVLLDLSMPGRDGLDILKQLKTKFPKLAVLILSQHPENQYALRALRAGASGYLTKESASTELITAIRKASTGGKYVSSALAESMADLMDQDTKGAARPHDTLSDREYDVLRRLGAGQTVSEAADELCLSVKTVSTYRTRIMEKMGLTKNSELIRYVIENRLETASQKEKARPSKR